MVQKVSNSAYLELESSDEDIFHDIEKIFIPLTAISKSDRVIGSFNFTPKATHEQKQSKYTNLRVSIVCPDGN